MLICQYCGERGAVAKTDKVAIDRGERSRELLLERNWCTCGWVWADEAQRFRNNLMYRGTR